MHEHEKRLQKPPLRRKIFLNAIDSYTGRNLSRIFSGKVKAATPEIEEVHDEETSESQPIKREYVTTVYGVQRVEGDIEVDPDFITISAEEAETRSTLLSLIESCSIVIYDITTGGPKMVEEALWAAEALHERMPLWKKQKIFVLISTVLTWCRTKVPEDDPDEPFTETDYRKRRAHPRFQRYLNCEKEIFKLGKTDNSRFSTYVIAAGATFGMGEDIFHQWMTLAWQNEPELTVYGSGNNIVPTIHILDLAQLIQYVYEFRPALSRYILAVDGTNLTQASIAKAISGKFSLGKIKRRPKEEVYHQDMSVLNADLLIADILMDGIVFNFEVDHKRSPLGFVEGIEDVVKEFKTERNREPIKILILGPPLSGKTFLARKLSQAYDISRFNVKDVIADEIKSLEDMAFPKEEDKPREEEEQFTFSDDEYEGSGVEDEEDFSDDLLPADAQDILEDIAFQKEFNKYERLDDETVQDFLLESLTRKPCQNQGFILEGYPKLLHEAKAMFQKEEIADMPEETQEENDNPDIMPELVILLEASDEFLCKRAMNLPEEIVTGTHWTEQGMIRRLNLYNKRNRPDKTVLNYFEELNIPILRLDVSSDSSPDMETCCKRIYEQIGPPRNYGPVTNEAEVSNRRMQEEKELEERRQQELQLAANQAREEAEAKRRSQEKLLDQMARAKKKELDKLETCSEPYRRYLFQNIVPSLHEGLIECAKRKPEDALAFLSECLIQGNLQTNLEQWEKVQRQKRNFRIREVENKDLGEGGDSNIRVCLKPPISEKFEKDE